MLPNGVSSRFSHFKSCGWLHSDLPGRGKVSFYNLLRIFGCLAYTHLPWNSDNGHCYHFKYYQPKCIGNTTSGCSGSIVNWIDYIHCDICTHITHIPTLHKLWKSYITSTKDVSGLNCNAHKGVSFVAWTNQSHFLHSSQACTHMGWPN